jgi:hypothetical protein
MDKKIISVVIAAFLGAGLGAFLGFGPLRKFKSEAVLNINMDTADYKKFTELASDQTNLSLYAANASQKEASVEWLDHLIKETKRADWHKPVLRIIKSDNKDVPEAVIRPEQEVNRKREQETEFENEKIFGKALSINKNDTSAFVGLKISALASEPQMAVDKTKWLSEYAHNIAATGALHILFAKWENENNFFAERFQIKKIQNEFETEQLKLKITSLKKSIENYPIAAQKEVNREIELGRDQTKTMTPLAQMLSAELDLLDIDIKTKKLNRTNEQHAVSVEMLKQLAMNKSDATGLNRLATVSDILTAALNKSEIQSTREKLLIMQGEVTNIKSKLIKKMQYISSPSVPFQQEGPAHIKLIILMGVLFSTLMMAYQWRIYILKLIKQEDAALSVKN